MSDAHSPPVDSFAATGPDVIAPGEGELILNLEGFEGPLDLLLTLARGLLDFIWGIRQLNYVLAVIGATPEGADDATHHAFGDVAGRVLNPALHAVNSGVRGYYFALAAASWLFGPLTFMAATAVAVSLLVWRQRRSPSARAIADLRKLLEATPET